MPLLETKGAASAQGFGLTLSSGPVNYIEDVFSTYLYTGNDSTQTITNGIDLSTKGGLVWIKSRAGTYVREHYLYDTARGTILSLSTDTTGANVNNTPNGVSAYNTTGFNIVGSAGSGGNGTGTTYVSWTFRKQPKFFDVVTYTGNGVAGRQIAHSLGSVPGCIIIKNTSTAGIDWQVYHRSLGSSQGIFLNLTNAAQAWGAWNYTDPTVTNFTVSGSGEVNGSVQTYVAYLFAHNAGGFGLSGTDNVISCGSFTTNGSGNATVNLGYEPQWFLWKQSSSGPPTPGNWTIADNMRGWTNTGSSGNIARLFPNTSDAETTSFEGRPTATGFDVFNQNASSTFIYIAIRRGPMKVPTSGASVFGLSARTGTGANATVTGSAGVSDAVLIKNRGSAVGDLFASRLTGTGYLETSSTAAEVAAGTTILQANPWDVMDGVKVGTTSTITNASANTYINYLFDRAPSFFDEVCYTGTGSATTVAHNLGVAPEMMIVKIRDGVGSWFVYQSTLGAATYATLNGLGSSQPSTAIWNNTAPTISVFSIGSVSSVNGSGSNYVAYLFASCAGVSKVGSYTGTGALQTVNCGFAAGARFVLIKRTDSTGDWYVYDSARGISSGNDPYLLLNSTAAEVTGTNYVDTTSVGFQVTAAAPADLNANGGTYIFLAIA